MNKIVKEPPIRYGLSEEIVVVKEKTCDGVPAQAAPNKTSNRLIVNIIANLLNYGISILIGIWLTPYLIRHLGIAVYGLIPLTTAFASYLSLLTLGLNAAVGRYLTIALEQRDSEGANRVFNTSLFGSCAVLCVIALPLGIASFHLSSFINIPNGFEQQVWWLFLCTAGVFFVSALGCVFDVVTYCRNRFDLRNLITVAGTITKVLTLCALFLAFQPGLAYFGVAMLAGAIATAVGGIIAWKGLAPELTVSRGYFDLKTLRCLTAIGAWSVLNQTGTILYLSIDVLVVNRLLGADAAGQYGALLQWSVLLRGIAGAVGGVFGPPVLRYYAFNEIQKLTHFLCRGMKYLGIVIALPVGLVCGFAGPLLALWLGSGYRKFGPLLALMVIHLSVNLSITPIFGLQTAANRVKWPAIVTLIGGLLNLATAVFLVQILHFGLYGVAVAGAVVLTLKNLVFTPLYGSMILGLKWHALLHPVLVTAVSSVGIATSCYLVTLVWNPGSLLSLGLAACVMAAAYCMVVLTVIGSEERFELLHRMGLQSWWPSYR